MTSLGMTGWGFILGAAGLITLIAVLAQMMKVSSLKKCSESVTGSVKGKFVHHGKNNRHYSLDVEYMLDGVTYKRSVPSVLSEYNSLEIGAPLELKYKPDNPKKIIRADSLTDKSMKTLSIVAAAAAALTIIGVVIFFIGNK